MAKMAEKHLILCGGAEAKETTGTTIHELQLEKKPKQIFLNIDSLLSKMLEAIPPVLHDLLEIATYVYVGDQFISRGGEKSFDYGNKWHRRLHYIIPVCKDSFWGQDTVKELLEDTLSAAAGETYTFEFIHRPERDRPNFLDVTENADYKYKIEEVLLFSGGLDSFTGAMDEIVGQGRNVCLVSHQSNGKLVKLQRDLHKRLADLSVCKVKPLHVPVLVNKRKDMTHDKSQRTRSFLFATLGAIVAHYEKLNRVRFYENGIVSCNLPWDGQTLQARATRSTHPKVLSLLSNLISEVVDYDFTFENPYFNKTKTDVVERLVELQHQVMIEDTRSCAGSVYRKPHTHCGTCSQCVDRRFATIAAKCEKCDPQRTYYTNIFIDELKETYDKAMAVGFVGFTNSTESSTIDSFTHNYLSDLVEISRYITNNGSEEGLKLLFELHLRHAKQINAVVDTKMAENVVNLRKGILPETCLVNMIAQKKHLKIAEITKKKKRKDTSGLSREQKEINDKTLIISTLLAHHRFQIAGKEGGELNFLPIEQKEIAKQ